VVRNFGSSGGTLNKGIEISSPVGSAVHSAGAGRVIYSSDGVAGYGNLIIIRHDDGFFSVYGFNKKNLVQVGTFVSRGQRIALSGSPPGGGSPRLHFEIRNGKDAVNPIFYLP
jgi:lipoprotein NlpD